MRNPKLVPYETIVRATSGEPEAIDEVLRNFRQTTKPSKRNCKRLLRMPSSGCPLLKKIPLVWSSLWSLPVNTRIFQS